MNTHSYEQGVLGESLVSETLAEFRPPYWHADNLIVSFGARTAKTTQIDHILASPFGIFVLETKKFRGAIAGVADDKLWFEILGHRIFPFSNPIDQNRHHISSVSFPSLVAAGGTVPVGDRICRCFQVPSFSRTVVCQGGGRR